MTSEAQSAAGLWSHAPTSYMSVCLSASSSVCPSLSTHLIFSERVLIFSTGLNLGLTMKPRLDPNSQRSSFLSLPNARFTGIQVCRPFSASFKKNQRMSLPREAAPQLSVFCKLSPCYFSARRKQQPLPEAITTT